MPSASALALTFVDAVNAGDEAVLRSMCSSTYQGFDTSREVAQSGRLALLQDLRGLASAFPDRHLTVVHQICSGHATGVFWFLEGTQRGPFLGIPATGRRVTICGYSHLDFEDGLLRRATHIWDLAALLRSLRLLPDLPPHRTSVDCLRGMRRTLLRTSTAATPLPTT